MQLRVLLACLMLSPVAFAEIVLAPVFGDHAILQCDKPVPIWGRAAPGERITVTFRDQSVNAVAGADGRWIVYLEPLAPSAEGADLIVAGRETIALRDVLVGEVWLASGQSNMEWPVSRVRDDEQRVAAVDLPLVRELKIERTVAGAPADTVPTRGWRAATKDNVGDFSAAAYFFARDLHRRFGIPIGIINSTWGGTAIESWMSERARADSGLGDAIAARWQQAMAEWPPERVARYPEEMAAWQKAEEQANATKTKNPLAWPPPPATPDSPSCPGGLFNAMIAPLQPAAIRGILWYQGESNASRPQDYAALFSALIRSWRENWGDDALPFYFVQLPNFADNDATARGWARLREAQAAALALPATGMAVTIDLGEADNIHPTRKMEVGRRLALIAKSELYGVTADPSGPVFEKATREGATMRVRFRHAMTGLVAHGRPVQSLELAGPDRVFRPATAKIDGNTLIVSSPEVKEPVAVRYAWMNNPPANLFNGAGLPAAPFRSDDW